MRGDDVIVMRTSGPSSITLDVTTDRAVIDATIRKVSGAFAPARGQRVDQAPDRRVNSRVAATCATASTLLETTPGNVGPTLAMLYLSSGYHTERGRALASASCFSVLRITCPYSHAALGSCTSDSWEP